MLALGADAGVPVFVFEMIACDAFWPYKMERLVVFEALGVFRVKRSFRKLMQVGFVGTIAC